MDIQSVKLRFGIIGISQLLNRAIDTALQVAPTDMSVLITGESGTGKEVFPKIIHQFSARKHGQYIAVNCGAIPEGTIDSELFGHEKGSFTGATDSRKGYFEVANNGTIFLDEIAELPLSTQVRLLRVLEAGEFMRVGSSKLQKTNVRVVAATNMNLQEAIQKGKFREDLFYRLSTVPIVVPALSARKEDVPLLFKKFASDFGDRYRMPPLRLDAEVIHVLQSYQWPGNIRQLKNITEQISVIEQDRVVTADVIRQYLPIYEGSKLPTLYNKCDDKTFSSEREILYQVLFDMKKDMTDLKSLVLDLLETGENSSNISKQKEVLIQKLYDDSITNVENNEALVPKDHYTPKVENSNIQDTEEIVEESLLLVDKEIELIKKALEKHLGKRKSAAQDLGISERTLYRKIKEYELDL